ncbi:hypothetical protein FHETE_4325 [Fusarium heterosporum]|uniref:GPI anchored protein n=1 Tax=Fusarium heterosporum TaxID=42747 RepID=A0A8H5WPS1_FUSHE|nr:hypothetical protein FHETE_4325 [Fusarium heterosporum]
MVRSLALLAGALATVAAQTTTVQFLLPLLDKQPLEGSVVGVKNGATTLAIHCPKGTDPSECGIPGTTNVVGGPSTMAFHYTMKPDVDGFDGGSIDQDMSCKLDPKKDTALCTIEQVAILEDITSSTSTVVSTSGYKEMLIPITVTAGVDKLNGGDDASPTGTEATTADKPKATGAQATETGTATSSEATSTPVHSDNAAGPMVTQNVILAAAAVVGGAAMLL